MFPRWTALARTNSDDLGIMNRTETIPRYDTTQTYRWNYDHAPEVIERLELPAVPGSWTFCRRPIPSPLGVPAGPLLNGRWVLYYAALGFDVLTYKTVRSRPRECYPLPNLVPVDVGPMNGSEPSVPTAATMSGSWAVSFGMPSMDPEVWRRDVEWTRAHLPREKVLSVSVVGTVQPDWSLDDLAEDYARCAAWAADSGADCIETNFSCPNVSTCDGQLYQQPESAAAVARRVREAIGRTPYIIKIGYVPDESSARALLTAVSPFIDAVAMTNSVATRVRTSEGDLLFDGQLRGICGQATLSASVAQCGLFARLLHEARSPIEVIGVGGASSAADVSRYLQAGAKSVHIATAAMVDPLLAARIRPELAERIRRETDR
jgi:dihydroorotate dehydrogenase